MWVRPAGADRERVAVQCAHFSPRASPAAGSPPAMQFSLDLHHLFTYYPKWKKGENMKLTRRQKEILDFVSGFIDREGYSPSMEEIAGHFQFASLNSVFKHLGSLEARGYLRRDPNRARSIELSRRDDEGSRILPLFGFVAAGRPIEAIANEETVAIPAEFLPGRGSYYVLRVKGESMIGDHIEDGDFVVVESRKEAAQGEMVVALVDGESVTLKRLYQEGDQIRLQPANPELQPIVVDAGRVQIQGIVVGLLRRYR